MMAIIKPVLDDWNRVIQEDWFVEPVEFDILRKSVKIRSFVGRDSMHGILVSRISGICEAYRRTWAIYKEDEGLVVTIN